MWLAHMFLNKRDGRFDFQATRPSALEDYRRVRLKTERWQPLTIIHTSDVYYVTMDSIGARQDFARSRELGEREKGDGEIRFRSANIHVLHRSVTQHVTRRDAVCVSTHAGGTSWMDSFYPPSQMPSVTFFSNPRINNYLLYFAIKIITP